MQIKEILSENRKYTDLEQISRWVYQGYYTDEDAIEYFTDAGLTQKEAESLLAFAKIGHPAALGEPGLIPGGQLPIVGDVFNPINAALLAATGGVGGAAIKKLGGNIARQGLKRGLATSASQAALAIAGNPLNLAKAKAYARQFPLFFSRKALGKMDAIRTRKFKRKIAKLTKENKFAMRDVERVKSLVAQTTMSSKSIGRQYLASLAWAGGFLAKDIIDWAQDPDATVGDLATMIGDSSLWEAAIILGLPVGRIVGMAAKQPLKSLGNLIKSLYRKYKNAGKVAVALAGISAAPAMTGSANVTKENVNEVFGLGKRGKQAAFAFGRLNPATVGHELMVNAIAQQPGDGFLFLSDRAAKLPTDPLSPQEKLEWARLSFNNVAVGLAKTVLIAADRLYKMGYTDIVFVEGEDKLFPLIERYNGVETAIHNYNFNSIKQFRLTRNPDAEDASGMSASKMRQAVIDNNFDLFRSGVTQPAQPQAQAMFDKLGQILGVNNG